MKPNFSQIIFFFSGSFFLSFFYQIFAQEVFIPEQEFDVSSLPPFTSNLLREQRDYEEQKERGEIESIIKRVVKGDEKTLEKQADELIQDKKKLDVFLSSFQDFSNNDNFLATLLNSFYQDKELIDKKIEIRLKESAISEAVELIGKMVGLDFVIDNNVKGKIGNISFTDVSVASVLKIILTSHKPKLALIKDLGVWRIMLLKDANLMFKSRAQALYEKLFVCGSKTIANAKWSETLKLCIEKMWDSIVGIRKGSKNMYLVFDDNTRSIFFRGEKKTIREFRHFLNEIDQRVPCVRIDARVVIAAKDFEESFGLQVSGVYNRSASVSKHWNFIGFGPVTTGGQGDIKPENLMDWTLNFLPSTAKQFLNAPFIFGGNNLNTRRLNLVLNAAEQRSEIETILKPSLLVNSGEIAEILVGQEVPIETSIQERIEGSLRDVNTISYKSLGMKLKVKPLVYPDQKTVFLDIFVENSYIKNGNAVTSFDAKTSIIVSNKSKNRVFLKSGQTTLIGGLISNEKRKEKQGIPILQNIPVLGFLFRGSRRVKSDDQLMIFITPTVV